jgi:hypothetical protein
VAADFTLVLVDRHWTAPSLETGFGETKSY